MCKLYDDIMLQTLGYIDAKAQMIDNKNGQYFYKGVIAEQTNVINDIYRILCNVRKSRNEAGSEDRVVLVGDTHRQTRQKKKQKSWRKDDL